MIGYVQMVDRGVLWVVDSDQYRLYEALQLVRVACCV